MFTRLTYRQAFEPPKPQRSKLGLAKTLLASLAMMACLILLPAGGAHADQIIADYPIGTIVAGRDQATNTAAYEQIVAAISLPTPATGTWTQLNTCSRNTLGAWASRHTSDLDDPGSGPYPKPKFERVDTTIIDLAKAVDPTNSSTSLTPALVEQTKTQRVLAIDQWLREQVPILREALQRNCGNTLAPAHARAKMRLLLSMRRCPIPLPKENYHPCNMKKLEGTGKIAIRERSYAQLFSWMQSQGPRQSNEWFDLTQGSPGQIIPLSASVSSSQAVWPSITAEKKIAEFEGLVAYLRALPETAPERLAWISPALPKAIGLSQNTGARVIDLIESPIQALEGLSTQAQALSVISDEVARSRITECVRLRRHAADDLSGIASCSGYNVRPEDLHACLNNLRCLPPISTEALAGVVRIVDSLDLKELASQTQLPRVGNLEYDVYKLAAKACAVESGGIPQEDAYQQAAMDCLMSKGLSAADFETYECAKRASNGTTTDVLACIPRSSPEFQVASQCWSDHPNDLQAALWCSGKSNVDPEVAECIQGFVGGASQNDALATCLTAQLGQDPRLATMMACAAQHSNDHEAAALCMVSPELPSELRGLALCGVSATSWEGFATCAVKDQLPGVLGGDMGKVVACGMQSGGSPVGTAVCLADTGLNATQQIALECAASSGGVPVTFAACAGGRLALKEFIDCKDVKFAEGRCFGENNEIRRFVRALGLKDIGPNSVVADAANAYLDVIKFQVRFAEDAFQFAGDVLSAGGDLVEGIGKGLEDLGKKTERAAKNVGREIGRGWKKARRLVRF